MFKETKNWVFKNKIEIIFSNIKAIFSDDFKKELEGYREYEEKYKRCCSKNNDLEKLIEGYKNELNPTQLAMRNIQMVLEGRVDRYYSHLSDTDYIENMLNIIETLDRVGG